MGILLPKKKRKHKNNIIAILIIMSLLTPTSIIAQSAYYSVIGIVRTSDGKPLNGATVAIKNGRLTLTDDKGKFTITSQDTTGIIKASFIGYQPLEMQFNKSNHKFLVVILQESTSQLKEVSISTGYQTLPKEQITGAVDQVDNQLINRSTGTNILDRLSGVTSGLRFNGQASQSIATGTADRNLGINIRGVSTLSGNVNTDPLIVLDNFPYEGQVGTLKIFISRLATKETFWVFSGDDFNLKISDKNDPGVLVLANDPNTQNINSACYSVILNRLTKLINNRGNLPSALIIDEVPTLYVHRVDNILGVARGHKVAVLLGLQELPQFQQQYGKDTAGTITSITGNVLAGSVRNKETLDWLERLFGKSKQIGESLSIDRNKVSSSLNEKLEALIPAGKMASLNTGEMVGLIAADAQDSYTGKFETSAVNCKVNLNQKDIHQEEAGYRKLPVYYDFDGKKDEILLQNFHRINKDIEAVIKKFKPAPAAAVIPKGSMKATLKANKPK
ncbi:TonB-dependent Receptor Plug Domain [Mucilaginibacter polytrichastri]|nr:TonB-dependent Receptor Plug Domain [Mucilaginibacter polytrichastri]